MYYQIYRCDNCKEVLSDKESKISKKHISVVIGEKSGYYRLDEKRPYDFWEKYKTIKSGLFHFCDNKCMVDKLLVKEEEI